MNEGAKTPPAVGTTLISDSPDIGKSPEVTVIMVSYNTRNLTVTALETLFANAGDVKLDVVVWDNASTDGSADAIAERFSQIRLTRSPGNIGFAAANNLAAPDARAPWLLLLNPDTETHPGAVEKLLAFAKANPQAGIVGGRTVFPDGSLNPSSCWRRMTLWSVFCATFGLTALFPSSRIFNPESYGQWQRDKIREVDIVSGCFLMLPTRFWRELGGFQGKYWMYGEEADMCLRARALGYRPMITPESQIMHLVGASSSQRADKVVMVQRARVTLIKDHWPACKAHFGIFLMWLWGANRVAFVSVLACLGVKSPTNSTWKIVWRERKIWLGGYSADHVEQSHAAG